MTESEKGIEKEVIVINVGSKVEKVGLTLRFIRLPEEPSEQILAKAIKPVPKSPMEKFGKEYAEGVMSVMQKQAQQLAPLLPAKSPPNTFEIILSREEYEKIGKPTVFDKLTFKLGQSS